jgi:hypothetical protein
MQRLRLLTMKRLRLRRLIQLRLLQLHRQKLQLRLLLLPKRMPHHLLMHHWRLLRLLLQ